jgi:hypothetical protein
MTTLHDVLFATIGPQMSILVSADTSITHMIDQSEVLHVWCNLLSFGRWLRKEGSRPPFGKRLVTKIVSVSRLFSASRVNPQLKKLCSGTLSILLEELSYIPESSRLQELDIVVATYVSFCRISEPSGTPSSLSTQPNLSLCLRMAHVRPAYV